MTLDFKKLVLNSVRKQMAVQHFECNAQLFGKDELPEAVSSKIRSVYGDTFLEDANYTLWFSGNNITKEIVEKTLFKVVNHAMGNSANDMVETDLKMIDLVGTETSAETPEETSSETSTLTDPGAEKQNGQAVSDLFGDDSEDDSAENDEDLSEINAEIADELAGNESDETDDTDEEGDDDGEEETGDSEKGDDAEEDDDEEGDEEGDDAEEGDEEEDLSESVETPSADEKFVFLKITMK